MRRWFPLLVLASACSSAGQYGYSRIYEPLDEEEEAAENVRELDPVEVERAPEVWRSARVSVFGVVKARKDGDGGTADLLLSMRALAPRNLCDSLDEASCRVTVSEREHAELHAIVALAPNDDIGKHAVAPGSLVRVIGRLAQGVHKEDGALVIRAEYYRHWPYGEYVTTEARDHMRM